MKTTLLRKLRKQSKQEVRLYASPRGYIIIANNRTTPYYFGRNELCEAAFMTRRLRREWVLREVIGMDSTQIL